VQCMAASFSSSSRSIGMGLRLIGASGSVLPRRMPPGRR
jgi:hypothetical protein